MEVSAELEPAGPTGGVALVVLAGGSSRRWGGVDKTARVLGDIPVLAHVVDPVGRGLDAVVVVAPAAHPARDVLAASGLPVRWTREDPPGGGPVAGLAAGLAALDASEAGVAVTTLVVLAGDMPYAGSAVPRLLAALRAAPAAHGAVGLDAAGVRQPLLAAYRRGPLGRALTEPGVRAARGRSLRDVLRGLTLVEVAVTARESLDLDTPERFAQVMTELHRPPDGADGPHGPAAPS